MTLQKIDGKKLMAVFEEAKMMKSEYTIIPRVLLQSSPVSNILGISYNAIIYNGIFDKLKDPYFFQLWDDPTLAYIAIETKNINNFKSDRDKIHCGDGTEIEDLYIDYEPYMINNQRISIAHHLREATTESGEYACVPLVAPNEMLEKINMLVMQREYAKPIIVNSDITTNEEFRFIIDAKAGAGASMWIPKLRESDFKPIPYGISLNTGILNVSKGDSIYLSIYDRIPQRTGDCFIAQFTVNKVKRKARIDTFLTMMKMI